MAGWQRKIVRSQNMASRLTENVSFLWSNLPADQQSVSTDSDDESDFHQDFSDYRTWANLPDIMIVKIYSILSLKDRYHASMVCKNWNRLFYTPTLWRKLVLDSTTFTRQRYTPFKGYTGTTELSNYKMQMCLEKVGRYIRTIQVDPFPEYYNLFQFLQIWNGFMEYYNEPYGMESLENFYFTFNCEIRDHNEVRIFGTGGRMLEELHRLLKNFQDLVELKLNNLLLDLKEAPGVMDVVVNKNRNTLMSLEVRNFTKELYPLFVAGMFPYLEVLVLSPQQLSADVLKMLARTTVRNIHIVQDHLVVIEDKYSIGPEVWKAVTETSPDLRIHLCASGVTPFEIDFQEGAPVESVTYTSKCSTVNSSSIEFIAIMYGIYLKTYGHFGLPRLHSSRSFSQRCDSNLVSLVRTCHNLTTLVIRDRISTATLIIIAREAHNLRNIYVRRNGLILKCDWQRSLMWAEDEYQSLRHAAKDFDRTFHEVSMCLGYHWLPLSDAEFKKLQPVYSDKMLSSGNDFDTKV